MASPLGDQLALLQPQQSLRFRMRVFPLADLLLTAHASRFTGLVNLEKEDHLFFREGSLVGLERVGPLGVDGIARLLVKRRVLEREEAEAFASVAKDGLDLCRRLEARALVATSELDRAVAEHARERLFARVADREGTVEVLAGVEALAHFYPVYIDPRPAIAFGLVVHGSPLEKAALMKRASDRRARLVVGYDVERNAYGLPPPVVRALRVLEEGIDFGPEPQLVGVAPDIAAGVLVLMERIGLLEIGEVTPAENAG